MRLNLTVLAVASALSCYAQIHSVEIRVSGLDCASCAASVEPRLKRVRGIASAKFDAERAVASITTIPENKVTLDAIRDALKGLGYTPGDAEIVVTGTAKDGSLSLPHQPDAFTIEGTTAIGPARIYGTVPAGSATLRARTAPKQE